MRSEAKIAGAFEGRQRVRPDANGNTVKAAQRVDPKDPQALKPFLQEGKRRKSQK